MGEEKGPDVFIISIFCLYVWLFLFSSWSLVDTGKVIMLKYKWRDLRAAVMRVTSLSFPRFLTLATCCIMFASCPDWFIALAANCCALTRCDYFCLACSAVITKCTGFCAE